ncbi:LL-diaminopimelate aminotransferase [Candidatus Kaiserbacteria bacterium RIFCSPLOWO2_12_FULL_53_8]|uniref:LL-diaminopimelate aminotransferase n=2 Tax=Candidatus Kaiseribacteriota TaxID=1752734 RepID=A0A1F6CVK0_9BACT|nr:MAG: LL-diaminopimelate aminotransferase [Candidatus Kaiserbacteria bacterium RIFCSPHIGHO2_01_FULL_53_29]OGG92336.1 MAG: LL-diaminopimelate aminotransferase [Candidatus Kaiserbacteria bacterium RIFCSPLOWO2_12_FULL_53_8]
MAKINSHYKDVSEGYFFLETTKRAKAFTDSHPGVELLKLGIGNTTEPIVPAVLEGLKRGVEKLGSAETYTGYGDEQGDTRLRGAIAEWYAGRKVSVEPAEVFVSDGAKPDCANISSIFSDESVVAIGDPVYPVYRDSNIIAGKRVVYMPALEENGFIPEPPREPRQGRGEHVDLIFLCSPNNPTGTVITREQLKTFVEYALEHKAIIVFDAAYSEYIRDAALPKSIYEIEGAKQCAIEIQSLSKAAGFTGVRLGWTIVPKELVAEDASTGTLNQMWNRRQTTMFNGASNIAQEGGLAVLSPEGQRQTHEQIDYYMENARIIREGLTKAGYTVFGGVHAPYIWLKCPSGLTSWQFFDQLLEKAHVIATPGSGFGDRGEGYMRVSAYGHRENIERAVRSISENMRV